MKKLLVLMLSISIMLGAAACGKSNGSSAASAAVDPSAKVLQIQASAKTFKFDQDEYHVKKGEPITISLVNVDGTHGINIQGLGVALSGSNLSKTITPDKTGSYDIVCTVPCGSGHMTMKSKLVVE